MLTNIGTRSSIVLRRYNYFVALSYQVTSNNHTNATAFFEACREEIIVEDSTKIKKYSEILQDNYQIKKVPLSSGINACVLPKSVEYWPTFEGANQLNAPLTNIYFERYCGVNKTRIDDIVENLRNTEHIAQIIGIGFPGACKSTEINTYLMIFLKNIGIPRYYVNERIDANTNRKWPNHVWYRCGSKLYQFSLNYNGNPKVIVIIADTLLVVERLVDQCEYKNDLVLFLDLNEGETNPMLACRVYIPLSNLDVENTTKTIGKRGGTYFLIQPPCESECIDMTQFFDEYSNYTHFNCKSLKPFTDGGDPVDRRKDIGNMTCSVMKWRGPMIRELLSSDPETAVL